MFRKKASANAPVEDIS